MNKVVALVGMAGAGKSEVSAVFEKNGYTIVHFGDATQKEIAKRGLAVNEANERAMREMLRKEYGMAAFAELNKEYIDEALKTSDVVVDGLYSWSEYIVMRDYYAGRFYVAAVWTSPKLRYERLGKRPVRPLTPEEAFSRDNSEISNLEKGGPIAMADYMIINNGTLEELREKTQQLVEEIG